VCKSPLRSRLLAVTLWSRVDLIGFGVSLLTRNPSTQLRQISLAIEYSRMSTLRPVWPCRHQKILDDVQLEPFLFGDAEEMGVESGEAVVFF
jgi:hypothetical protein